MLDARVLTLLDCGIEFDEFLVDYSANLIALIFANFLKF